MQRNYKSNSNGMNLLKKFFFKSGVLIVLAVTSVFFVPVSVVNGYELDPDTTWISPLIALNPTYDLFDDHFTFLVRDKNENAGLDGLVSSEKCVVPEGGHLIFGYILKNNTDPDIIFNPVWDYMDPNRIDFPVGWRNPVSLSIRAWNTGNTTDQECDSSILVRNKIDGAPLKFVVPPKINNRPELNLPTGLSVNETELFSAIGSFTDNDSYSTNWNVTVDYGDGSDPGTLSYNNDKFFELAHTYANAGTYTIKVSVTDNGSENGDQDLTNTASTQVTVHDVYELDPSTQFLHGVSSINSNIVLTDVYLGLVIRDTGPDGTVEGIVPTCTALGGPTFFEFTVWNKDKERHYSVFGENGYGNASKFEFPTDFKPVSITMKASKSQENEVLGTSCLAEGDDGLLIDSYDGVNPLAYDPASNTPPQISAIDDAAIGGGSTYTANGSFTDMHSKSWSATVDYGDGAGPETLTLSNNNFSLNHVYSVPGNRTLTVKVTDNQGATGTETATILVNAAPLINPLSGGTINEGGTYIENGSITDPDSTSWTGSVDYGDGSGVQPLQLHSPSFTLNNIYKDDGIYTVTITVTDNQGAIATKTIQVTVNNVPPVVGAISGPADPLFVPSSITVSANFTDPGNLDSHTAAWDWGDGQTSNGTVAETNGSGSVKDGHTYTKAGIYTIKLTVSDKNGGSGNALYNITIIKGDGLSAVYYNNKDFTGNTVKRIDPAINFNWGYGSPAPGISHDTFSVRWTGYIVPLYTERYTFYSKNNDGAKLWVNGTQVINAWRDQSATENSGSINLTAGQKYTIKMEYFEDYGQASVILMWKSGSQAKQVIPTSQLYSSNIIPVTPTPVPTTSTLPTATLTPVLPTATSVPPGDGLSAVYYNNKDFTGTTVRRIDPMINFNWGYGSPATGISSDTFSVRWTGYIVPRYSQKYTFYSKNDDGARLWVNGAQIVNSWTDQSATEHSGSINLTAGQKYPVRLEYYEDYGQASIILMWSSSSQAKQVIPTGQLYSK